MCPLHNEPTSDCLEECPGGAGVTSFISMNCVFTAFEQSDSAPKHQKGLTIIIVDDDNTPIGQKPIAADSDIEMDVINSSEDELQSANLHYCKYPSDLDSFVPDDKSGAGASIWGSLSFPPASFTSVTATLSPVTLIPTILMSVPMDRDPERAVYVAALNSGLKDGSRWTTSSGFYFHPQFHPIPNIPKPARTLNDRDWIENLSLAYINVLDPSAAALLAPWFQVTSVQTFKFPRDSAHPAVALVANHLSIPLTEFSTKQSEAEHHTLHLRLLCQFLFGTYDPWSIPNSL
ncbi:hypothetical protein B0H14DRAFT_2580800 [Mycena olivaceomarginata]|nr:hypothetical protein B0H14DRAFT_2580800 [Mycena olivaceomarginata]